MTQVIHAQKEGPSWSLEPKNRFNGCQTPSPISGGNPFVNNFLGVRTDYAHAEIEKGFSK